MPSRMLRVGESSLDRLAVDEDLALVEVVQAEDDLGQLGAARAHQAEDAQHLALVQRQVDAVDDAGLGELPHLEGDLRAGR